MPELSVIIVTLRDKKEIDCISVFKQSEFDNYELIIRRDAGISTARNNGIQEASADKLIFIDDDATPHEGYLSTVSESLDHHPIVAGKIINPDDGVFAPYGANYDQGERGKYTTNIVGANMAFRREVFEKVGDFDENLQWGHDETDLADRALYEYPIYYEPDLMVTHTFVDSIREFFNKRYQYGIADAHLARKEGLTAKEQYLRVLNTIITPSNHIHDRLSVKGSVVKSLGTLIRSYSRVKHMNSKSVSKNSS